MRSAGLIYGEDAHYLDHLGVLCKILGIPLIVTDEKIEQSAKKYYPNLSVLKYDPLETAKIILDFQLIFTCLPRPLFNEIFYLQQALLNQRVRTIWIPHGNSDKGRKSPYMEALQSEEIALVYGKQMIDFLEEKEVLSKLKRFVTMGNFRYRFYQRNRAFYSALVKKEILCFLKSNPKKIILYAPTWQDQEQSSSFLSASPILLENLPKDYALIVKPHPNLLKQQGELIQKLSLQYKSPNILFLNDFPPIYPLLAHIDIYIGDMSSIGYDFLAFNRPLFFLNESRRDCTQDLGFYLARCGTVIEKEEYATIYEKIKKSFIKNTQKEIYEYAFGKPKSFKTLKNEIEEAARSSH
ncbi:MAG TPA: CDP-glycerol glycerophosphotransferase family protein [Rhabdochlamydiaceae bacterium]|nr:CDP-glycerol glycerophosphotransferase family protein [Rhabdochlamydiaceae bacterium]